MPISNDDSIPSSYRYAWTTESDISLDDFLAKYRPSMVQNDGTKPWIWVDRCAPSKEDTGVLAATTEAAVVLEGLTDTVESIKNDDSIPVRANKKAGTKSKKETREAAQAEATKKLETISIKHGFVSGKWLVFAPADKVDVIWSSIAKSLVSGPLSSTCAFEAKVATSPEDETPNYQHIICIYMPDVYDKPKVLEVMKILLRNHGLNLSGVKSNLYTHVGIDSKHLSGIQSTIWKNSALLPDSQAKELKDAYFAELASKAPEAEEKGEVPAPVQTTPSKADLAPANTKGKSKLKQRKKKASDDPFASEEDEPKPKPAVKASLTKVGAKRKGIEAAGDDKDDEKGNQAKRPRRNVS